MKGKSNKSTVKLSGIPPPPPGMVRKANFNPGKNDSPEFWNKLKLQMMISNFLGYYEMAFYLKPIAIFFVTVRQ